MGADRESWDEKHLGAPSARSPLYETPPLRVWLIPPISQTRILLDPLTLTRSHSTAAAPQGPGQVQAKCLRANLQGPNC